MNHKVRRVFFHELGHYISQKYFYDKHGINHQTERILIQYSHAEQDYLGRTSLIKPKDYNPNDDKLINPQAKIIELIYGCIFQSICKNELFESCFCTDNDCNGRQDYYDLVGAINALNGNYNSIRHQLMKISQDHLNLLKSKSIINLFDEFELTYLLKEENDDFEVDLLKLQGKCKKLEDLIYPELDGLYKTILDLK